MDQIKISKESWAPAQTISPLESTATQENWVGLGDVKVRKFRYLPRREKPQLTSPAEAPVFRGLNAVAPSRASVHTTCCPTIPEPPASLSPPNRGTACFEPETEQKSHL